MGDLADYFLDEDMNQEIHIPHTYIWTMANGDEIQIDNMSTNHITNTLNALKEKRIYHNEPDIRKRWIRIFTEHLQIR